MIRGIGPGEAQGYRDGSGDGRITGSFSSVQRDGVLPTFRWNPATAQGQTNFRNAQGYANSGYWCARNVGTWSQLFRGPAPVQTFAVFSGSTQSAGPYTGIAWPGNQVVNVPAGSRPLGITYWKTAPGNYGSYSVPLTQAQKSPPNTQYTSAGRYGYGPAQSIALLGMAYGTAGVAYNLGGQVLDPNLNPGEQTASAGGALFMGGMTTTLASYGAWEFVGRVTASYAPAYFPSTQMAASSVAGVGVSAMQIGGAVGIGAGIGLCGRSVDKNLLQNRASATIGMLYLSVYDTVAMPYHWWIGQGLYDNTAAAYRMGLGSEGGQDIGW